MSSKDKILSAIKESKPASTALPVIDISAVISFDDLKAQFKKVLETIGGVCIESVGKGEMEKIVAAELSYVQNGVNTLGAYDEGLPLISAEDLASVDLAVISGTVAVAENGAIWVSETQMVNRILPFIAQQLIIVIEKKDIVTTMHHAYQKIDVAETGFGAFIAGPSKTADIEQSLVIGAHGPAGLKVIIY
ncbi:MAG: LUD domain-containing protein [Chitinophagaceae bacterium]|nr:LUD domain-containing protein [Chitinophagaceae bacterium]